MRDDATVVALVARAVDGETTAWNDLVERYAPLVWSICRRHRLSRLDAEDIAQTVWLTLVERLPLLREPAALPGWIATTARRECLRVLRVAQRHGTAEMVPEIIADDRAVPVDQEVLAHERDVALREAFAQLPPRCQVLLSMLIQDPPVPYGEISAKLRMAVGSIGPSRARCLDRLRQCPALAALIRTESAQDEGGDAHG
jgi:RNA polymerase sigma factor (sigma-70 family)